MAAASTLTSTSEPRDKPRSPDPSPTRGVRPSRDEVSAWNRELEGRDPDAIIRFAAERFGSRLAVATQFGVEGCTLVHRVSQLAPESFLFTVDTGLLFEETYDLCGKLERMCGVTIHKIRPEESVGRQAVSHGPNLWENDPDLCCTLRKVMPMQGVLERYDAWMTSVRREQTENRADTPVVQWDEKFDLVKFSPYAAASFEYIQNYVREHQVPTNPLRLVGYQSIGCMPCTRPTREGEDPRAGRWWRVAKTECGLHTKK